MAFTGVASVAAMPGTCGFVGAVLVLWGVSSDMLLVALVAAAVLVNGASVVWAYRRVLGGSHLPAVWSAMRWPRARQMAMLALLTLVILAIGIMPGIISTRTGKVPTVGKEAASIHTAHSCASAVESSSSLADAKAPAEEGGR